MQFTEFTDAISAYSETDGANKQMIILPAIFTTFLLSPAHVVRWLDHLGAMCVECDVCCVPLVRGSIRAAARVRRVRLRKSNFVKIIPTHMMIREIIPGRQQRVRRCPP